MGEQKQSREFRFGVGMVAAGASRSQARLSHLRTAALGKLTVDSVRPRNGNRTFLV